MNSQIVLDACGAAISPQIAKKMMDLMEAAKVSPDEVELHPAQLASLENLGLFVKSLVEAETVGEFVDVLLIDPKGTLAGIPIKQSVATSKSEIFFKCDDVTVGTIQNLHIPKGWTN